MLRNVLCIGHNKAMNYLIVTVLGNLYTLLIVEDVFHGMNILKQKHDIHLIIIDIDYQTKENIDFILHIKSSKLYNKPLIVLLSVQNQKANKSVIEHSAYHYFEKPFNPIDLVNTINNINSMNGLKPSTSLS